MFSQHLVDWGLVADGDVIATPTARLLPVRWQDKPAMLKLFLDADESRSGALMAWWAGEGAARVFARDDAGMLMERASGAACLAHMSRSGQDDAACRILCATAARLHTQRPISFSGAIPLAQWFGELGPIAAQHGGLLVRCAAVADELLESMLDATVLHGDLHHGNVLDFEERGWLAIDPKGLIGDRGFDYVPMFINPDVVDPTRPVATDPGRFSRRVEVVAAAAGLERTRLLQWILAGAGLSAAWFIGDGKPAAVSLRIAELAALELGR